MNKKVILILLVGLVFVAGLTFVYAKHINKEATPLKAKAYRGETRAVDEPTVPMVQRVQTGTLSEKPKSIYELKRDMAIAGKTYTPPEEQLKTDFADVGVTKIVTPAGMIDEWSLFPTECMLYVHNQPCCYAQPWPGYYDSYMNCVGSAEYWQYQDPNFRNDWNECGYPIYPVEPTSVNFFIITPAPCTLEVEFAVVWDFGTIYWGYPFPYYPAPDWSSGPVTIFLPEAGSYYVNAAIPAEERPCYHVPFFARFWLLNSDDFTDGPDAERCGQDTVWGHLTGECVEPVIPDEDSCIVTIDTVEAVIDTIWGHWECVAPVIPEEDSCIVRLPNARYGFWISGVFDQGSVRNQGYYWSDQVGGYYDIVDIKGGNMRVRSTLLTRDQNECELESLWYHKASYGNWECTEPVEEHLELCVVDTTPQGDTIWGSFRLVTPVDYGYAPDGMPDFNQYQFAGPAYCGPTALANCLWWTFAGGFPWYIISNWYEAWDPTVPPMLINELAACMNTDPDLGTDVYDLQACVLSLNDTYGFWLTETTIVQPTFEDIEYQVRLSQDVILLLGFWYMEGADTTWGHWECVEPVIGPDSCQIDDTTWGHWECVEPVFAEEESCIVRVDERWYRIGGHYVTVSGVNWEYFMFSFSDPAINGVCDFSHPGDSSGGVYFSHDHASGACIDPPCHNDAGNVSHDYYQIALASPSPGGVLAIPEYYVDFAEFFEQNVPPEFAAQQSPTGEPQYPIVTEIEFAVVICPGRPFVLGDKDSWNMWMGVSNYGEEGLEIATWQYYPELNSDGFEGTVILGTGADDLALSVTAIGEDIRFFPTTALDCYFADYESIEVERCEAQFYHNVPGHELPLEIDMLGIGLDPGEGWLSGHPLGDVVINKFAIHNTGEETLTDVEWAIFFDFDVNYANFVSANPSFGGGDSLTNTMWAYDSTREDLVVYVTLAPTHEGQVVRTVDIGDQNTYFYPHVPGGPYDELDSVMNQNFFNLPDKKAENTDIYDYGYLMSSALFDIEPCTLGMVLQEYLIWYDWQIPSNDYTAYRCKLYRLLRGAGFYRGDVGDFATGAASPGILDVADIVYIVNWLWRDGPDPDPFVDQGDVDCDGETKVEDVVYLVNYVLRGSEIPPIDKNRFFDEEYQTLFSRTSLFVDDQWKDLGAGCPLD